MNENMKTLPGSGYRIEIDSWIGRLGNQLMQITAGINLARQTQSVLKFPKHSLIKQNHFDFRQPRSRATGPMVRGNFFMQQDCYQFPIKQDSVRRKICQDFLYEHVAKRQWTTAFLRWFQKNQCEVDDETLVINMRSGKDIFRENPPEDCRHYLQPPLSFYKYIIESHGYKKCVIVTEGDRRNPVIPALLSWNRDIELLPHVSVQDDIATILNAKHLVTAHSSFSWCLALMSKNLRVLHQPFTCQIRGISDYEINTYDFSDYFAAGEWCSTANQLAYMISHPLEKVSREDKPFDPNELSSAL